ncbi:hypothetical protein B0H13DRAFT_2422429 [Mycena leptocephala]|nr:hypothetical protein B0H13DRAFT_2422429 [Mycena leptocephala]
MVLANQTLSDDSEKDTQLFSKPVHPNLGVEQQFCPHAHIVDVSGHRESEVDARNILPETLACSRVLTTRKRTAIEERYTKKVKKPYLQDSYDSGPLIDVVSIYTLRALHGGKQNVPAISSRAAHSGNVPAAGAKICKPLISDGVEEQALLRGVEDGSPARAVAKSLRCDGVSGRNAFQSSAPRAAFARGRASHMPWNTNTTAYRRSGLTMRNQNSPAYSCMIPGEADIDAALITMLVLCLCRKIIGSNELSLNAIKVTRFRQNKRSNEVTKKATTRGT